MQQKHTIDFLGCSFGQFLMHAVQRIPRLEGDDIGMPECFQRGSCLGRREGQILEIIVRGQLNDLQPAGDVDLAPAVHLGDQRMSKILRAEGFSNALDKIFTVAQTVDQKTMTLQYFEALKAIGAGASTKYIFPLEFTSMMTNFLKGEQK